MYTKAKKDDYSWVDQPDILDVLKNPNKLHPEVKKYIEENNLYNKACALVIPASQYDTYLMEPPEVKENEKKNKIKIKKFNCFII